jgi:hypothetical protein
MALEPAAVAKATWRIDRQRRSFMMIMMMYGLLSWDEIWIQECFLLVIVSEEVSTLFKRLD